LELLEAVLAAAGARVCDTTRAAHELVICCAFTSVPPDSADVVATAAAAAFVPVPSSAGSWPACPVSAKVWLLAPPALVVVELAQRKLTGPSLEGAARLEFGWRDAVGKKSAASATHHIFPQQ
jgi:hypothetical protein